MKIKYIIKIITINIHMYKKYPVYFSASFHKKEYNIISGNSHNNQAKKVFIILYFINQAE